MGQPILALRNVSKSFPGVKALVACRSSSTRAR